MRFKPVVHFPAINSLQKNDIKSPNLKLSENKTPDCKSMLSVITQCFSVRSKSFLSPSAYSTVLLKLKLIVPQNSTPSFTLEKFKNQGFCRVSRLELSGTKGWGMYLCSILVNNLLVSEKLSAKRDSDQRAKLVTK